MSYLLIMSFCLEGNGINILHHYQVRMTHFHVVFHT